MVLCWTVPGYLVQQVCERAVRGKDRKSVEWKCYGLLAAAKWLRDSSARDRTKRYCLGLVDVIGISRMG